ncbi:MAG: hypothetical protein WD035_00945 [Balneolaceae bacterium]
MNKSGEALIELEQRKKRIEAELNQIHQDMDSSVDVMKEKVLSTVLPVKAIRKKPFKAVGIALIAGFALGLPRLRMKSRRREKNYKEERGRSSQGMTSLMFDEMKHIAARRAVRFFMDTVDEKLSARLDKNKRKENRESVTDLDE